MVKEKLSAIVSVPEQSATEKHSEQSLEGEEGKDVLKFSDETKAILIASGYKIYTIKSVSIADLRKKGAFSGTNWQEESPFETMSSEACEVAIRPEQLYLKGSENKNYKEQRAMVKGISRKLARKGISDAEAVIGTASDYAQLIELHKAFGKRLLGEFNNPFYIRTSTIMDGKNILVSNTTKEIGASFSESLYDTPSRFIGIAEIVKPKPQLELAKAA